MALKTRLGLDGGQLKRPSALVLIAANLVPLYGVFLLDWPVFPIILLFWMENLVVGAINILKILAARPDDTLTWLGKIFLVPFFSFHYGMFCLVHGIFVMGLFGGQFKEGAPFPGTEQFFKMIWDYHLGWAILALALSHLFSFWTNYLRSGEYRQAALKDLMNQPYSRVVVLHLTILGGGFLMALLHSPVVGLILLLALKTSFDVRAHLKERKKFAEA